MISIVIPNYNGLEHLKTCYESLKKQSTQDFTVLLADNGSSDESINLQKNNSLIQLSLKLGYNSGFAKAVNAGIKHSLENLKADYIFLLNNDIELAPDFLEVINKTFIEHTETSIIAVKC